MWEPVLSLSHVSDTPLFLQIAHAVTDAIQAGQLRSGERLPGSRSLARQLGVHRNTVLTAYAELEAQGWLCTEQARGTFVSGDIPDRAHQEAVAATQAWSLSTPPQQQAGFTLPHRRPLWAPEAIPHGMLTLLGGRPDLQQAPVKELSRAYRRAIRRADRTVLDYGDPRGWPALRSALANMLRARRGLAADAETLLVTRGSQMALYLVGQVLIRPGDVVAVEELGYRPAWSAFQLAGAQLEPIPVDHEGIQVDRLAERVQRGDIRAVYVTPHHQYPTLAVLSAGRRLQLLELARTHRFAIIEDDYDHEFHFEGRPILPLASADRSGVVIYIGSLSKVLAPGPRIGYVVAPQEVLTMLAEMRRCIDRQGDFAIEAAVAELIQEGELQRHIRRMHRIYQHRRDLLIEALDRHLPGTLRHQRPPGGMALWVEVLGGHDTDAWASLARTTQRVLFAPGSQFTFDRRPRPYLRLGFARLQKDVLDEAVRRMAEALHHLSSSHPVAPSPL